MKKLILFLFLFVGFQVVKAQESDSAFNANDAIIQKMPVFVGGQDSLYSYLKRNTIYPESAITKNIEGTVYVTFIVSKTGKVIKVKVLKSIDNAPELDSTAVTVVRNMPNWIPGKINEKNADVQFSLPIKFTVIDDTVKNDFAAAKKSIDKRPFSPTTLAFVVVFFLLLILLFLQMFHRWRHK